MRMSMPLPAGTGFVSTSIGKRAAAMAQTRERLIAAARHAFATQGYAASSMDDLTATAGLTRGALYHNFGDKPGLLAAVIERIDAEMAQRLETVREKAPTLWDGLLDESCAYIEMATEPEIQRVMLLDGPAVLGDPSKWPGEGACLQITIRTVQALVDERTIPAIDVEAAARLLNGAALTAALWVASADDPKAVLAQAVAAFRRLASGLRVDADR